MDKTLKNKADVKSSVHGKEEKGSILIMRFSALGDVAMTIPIIYSLAEKYPDLQITVMSRANFETIFQELPANVSFLGVDLKNYTGLFGLNKLYKELKTQSFDYVADFHDVLRTKYLRLRFKLAGIPTAFIDKGRKEKEKLTRKHNKVFEQLDTSFVRYQKALEKLGFDFRLNFTSIYGNKPADNISADTSEVRNIIGEKGNDKWIGIAPFAKHKGKIYPLELQEEIIAHFEKKDEVKLFLFGGGKSEMDIVSEWKNKKYPKIVSVIGKLNMKQELALLSNLDLILSMDSANMHLASLVNVPVVSVWGATHLFAGFMGWNQSHENVVQLDLPCRPCSIFGQKSCYRGDYACMYGIRPEQIINTIEKCLKKNENNSAEKCK